MALLILNNNSGANPLTITLTNELNVQTNEGLDPAAPTYSDKQFTRSLLKEGGVYTYEHADLKEIIFPMLVGAGLNLTSSGLASRIQLINNIINTPGASAEWQDDGTSQPTYYPVVTGILDIEYDYRSQSTAHFARCKLRLFSLPFVVPATPRFYAAASGVGPLLMISGYASSGANILGATTQAGVAGFGGQQQPSGGVFYGGAPSLGGDAPAVLQVSYAGPLPPNSTTPSHMGPPGMTPTIAFSVLPDAGYRPMVTASQLGLGNTWTHGSTAVASTYVFANNGFDSVYQFFPYPTVFGSTPNLLYQGNHRMFAIARATGATSFITVANSVMVPNGVTATVPANTDWQTYDLGVMQVRASETTPQPITFTMAPPFVGGVSAFGSLDVTALVVLPESSTWFFNPNNIAASQYGVPQYTASNVAGAAGFPFGAYGNTILVDDTVPDQFIYVNASSLGFAPSPANMTPSSMRITPYTRGVFPRPEPFRGIPPLAIFGVNQAVNATYNPLLAFPVQTGGSWANPQNLPAYVQINVLERARYILP